MACCTWSLKEAVAAGLADFDRLRHDQVFSPFLVGLDLTEYPCAPIVCPDVSPAQSAWVGWHFLQQAPGATKERTENVDSEQGDPRDGYPGSDP